jgi:hypothetical protein
VRKEWIRIGKIDEEKKLRNKRTWTSIGRKLEEQGRIEE